MDSSDSDLDRQSNQEDSFSVDGEAVSSNNKFNEYSICAFAVTIVIGGQYYGWNAFLKNGFGLYAMAQLLVAAAYIVYVCSIAEIVSGFPFSGGGYGLSRVAQGYYVGFLVGCCEVLEYIAYSAMSFIYIAELLCSLFLIDSKYSLLFCFLCYVLAVSITVYGGKLMIYTNYILAAVSLLIVLLFCFGTAPSTNFLENASLRVHQKAAAPCNWFNGGIGQFLLILPDTTCFFGGIEALCLLPSYTKDPKVSIPRGLLLGMSALFATSILVMFTVAAMPGGIAETSELVYPMEKGFNLMFNCTRAGMILLMIPAQFGMGFGFVLPYAKLLEALGTTNLLPSVLRLNHCKDHTNGAIVGSILGFALSVLSEYYEGGHLPYVCILAGFLTYLSQLHGYWMLKTRYSQSAREFHSPFGLVGVVFASLVFLLGIVGIVGFNDNRKAGYFVMIYLVVLSAYYFLFAAKTQTISKEEQAVLFQLHVVNHNRRKKHLPHWHKSPHVLRRKCNIVPADGGERCGQIVHRDASVQPTSVTVGPTVREPLGAPAVPIISIRTLSAVMLRERHDDEEDEDEEVDLVLQSFNSVHSLPEESQKNLFAVEV